MSGSAVDRFVPKYPTDQSMSQSTNNQAMPYNADDQAVPHSADDQAVYRSTNDRLVQGSAGPNEREFIGYDNALSLVKEEVDRALFSSHAVVKTYTSHLALTRGKFFRAASLLTCAMNNDGLIDYNAVKLAAAVEVLHLATLVHDDVIDDADIRRGLPTLQKKFGKKTAVICGDYLLSTALRMAASVENKRDYLDIDVPDYVARICVGELTQHVNNGNFDLSFYQYLKIIAGKTAALFEASFFAGAVLSGCGSHEYNAYKKLGRCLGMVFQLTDDCMDFEADEDMARKPVQSDFEKGVVTLPVILAFRKDASLKERAARNEVTADEINRAVVRTEGLSFTRLVAKRYYSKYIKLLDRIDAAGDKKKRLTALADRALMR